LLILQKYGKNGIFYSAENGSKLKVFLRVDQLGAERGCFCYTEENQA
jgi:hypothetical protein